MRFFLLFLTLGVAIAACNKSETVVPDALTGIWVEKTARQDTLVFNLDHRGNFLPSTLTVYRGRALNAGGSLVPKLGSGPYGYQLKPDSITVGSGLSSSLRQSSYLFRLRDNELTVGNFFELGFNQPATAVRTLVRLR